MDGGAGDEGPRSGNGVNSRTEATLSSFRIIFSSTNTPYHLDSRFLRDCSIGVIGTTLHLHFTPTRRTKLA